MCSLALLLVADVHVYRGGYPGVVSGIKGIRAVAELRHRRGITLRVGRGRQTSSSTPPSGSSAPAPANTSTNADSAAPARPPSSPPPSPETRSPAGT